MATGSVSSKIGKILDLPANAPTIGTATDSGTGTGATVAFTAPSAATGGPIFDYIATSSPGSITGTGTSSPITVNGLTTGTSYTFTVAARNPSGSSPLSSASNSVTPVQATSYESIATVTVGSGGAANVEFTSIAADWTHLQIRCLNKRTSAGSAIQTDSIRVGNGSIDTASNYSLHLIEANGSSVVAGAGANQSSMYSGNSIDSGATSVFAVSIIDILDYANTNKHKTIRVLSGVDNNGSGVVSFHSGSWRNTAAITHIRLYPTAGNIAQYSSFALYGVKGA